VSTAFFICSFLSAVKFRRTRISSRWIDSTLVKSSTVMTSTSLCNWFSIRVTVSDYPRCHNYFWYFVLRGCIHTETFNVIAFAASVPAILANTSGLLWTSIEIMCSFFPFSSTSFFNLTIINYLKLCQKFRGKAREAFGMRKRIRHAPDKLRICAA